MPDLTNQQLLETIRKEFATKDDLKGFVNKDDLKQFATKEDIAVIRSEMATKDDLKQFATKDDMTRLESKIDRIDRKFDGHRDASTMHHLKILEEIGHLNQKFTKVAESQAGLGRRFNKLRIVTE